ncbi:MAG: hypothetical protein PHQ60_15945 [Sideroxydans sp.]|nr:hypothetical protein [Sideroxydans sp.]
MRAVKGAGGDGAITNQTVIPAQAGIQMINESPRKWDNTEFARFAESLFLLDSGLRRNDGI